MDELKDFLVEYTAKDQFDFLVDMISDLKIDGVKSDRLNMTDSLIELEKIEYDD